jgi:predicted flap endonuclease-1-like 5' DNA nuclease
MTEIQPVLLVAAAGAFYVWERWNDEEEPDEWEPEGAAEAMNCGEITPDEQARRAAAAAEAPDGFRDGLRRVDQVGDDLSGRIRAEYPGPEFIKRASADELEEIHGVGESIASELKERYS